MTTSVRITNENDADLNPKDILVVLEETNTGNTVVVNSLEICPGESTVLLVHGSRSIVVREAGQDAN